MMSAREIAKSLDPNFRSSGNGFVCRCPAHDDDKPSLKLEDAEGKILVHCHAGCDQKVVIGELKARGLWPEKPRPEPKPKGGKINIVKTYDYFDHQTGELLMQVCRLEPKSFRQRRPDGKGGWTWSVAAEFRTLYRAPEVVKATGPVLVVEGEKDADRLWALGIPATCNPGGAGKWDQRYSEILRGKDVVIVPDNDEAGAGHADIVARSIAGVAARVRVLHLPDLPPKGDVSDWLDAGGDRAALGQLVKGAPDWAAPVAAAPQADNDNGDYFTPLGYNKGSYYFLSHEQKQVIERSASALTASNLLELAPLMYWELEYPAKSGFNAQAAASNLIRRCVNRGIWDPSMMRGRGAWYDAGRVVVHCGRRLYVDRRPTSPSSIISDYVYEVAKPIEIDIDNPLPVDDARRFLSLMRRMPWVKPVHAVYAAGWCALAPIGGVLNWRPHIWVTGGRGSGKSHVMSSVIKPALGKFALFVVGSSSEAGIRQSLRSDAIPVLFDEAEGQDHRANDRLQRILELVRQSSSETGGGIAKGSTSGQAVAFQIRSCFAFSSINASLVQASDQSRVTVLELAKERQQTPIEELQRLEAELLTEQYVHRLQARSVALAAVIRKNAATFARAVAVVMGEQRAGDQLGTLLAGAYSLQSDEAVTCEQAGDWVQKFDWTDEKAEVREMSDEAKLLQEILQAEIRVPVTEDGIERERTLPVYDIIARSKDNKHINTILQARGIKVLHSSYLDENMILRGAKVFIAKDTPGIRKMLQGTPWEHADYTKVLARHPNVTVAKNPTHFPGLGMKRGVEVDLSV